MESTTVAVGPSTTTNSTKIALIHKETEVYFLLTPQLSTKRSLPHIYQLMAISLMQKVYKQSDDHRCIHSASPFLSSIFGTNCLFTSSAMAAKMIALAVLAVIMVLVNPSSETAVSAYSWYFFALRYCIHALWANEQAGQSWIWNCNYW